MNPTIDLINTHRSIRKFTDEPVPQEHIDHAMHAGQMAATSSAVQPYCVIHITDSAKRQAIANLCGPQQKVHDCGAFFIICADLRKHMLIFDKAGKDYDQGLEAFLIATIDASLFAQNFVLAFESLGYGTCYIGGLRNDLPAVDELLSLPQGVCPIYGLCVGVPDESPSKRPRIDAGSMLFTDQYPSDNETHAMIDSYDALYAKYLRDRGAKPGTWSASMLNKFGAPSRPNLAAYYTSKGARLD